MDIAIYNPVKDVADYEMYILSICSQNIMQFGLLLVIFHKLGTGLWPLIDVLYNMKSAAAGL